MVLRAASIGVLSAQTTRTLAAHRVEGLGAGGAEAVGGSSH